MTTCTKCGRDIIGCDCFELVTTDRYMQMVAMIDAARKERDYHVEKVMGCICGCDLCRTVEAFDEGGVR